MKKMRITKMMKNMIMLKYKSKILKQHSLINIKVIMMIKIRMMKIKRMEIKMILIENMMNWFAENQLQIAICNNIRVMEKINK